MSPRLHHALGAALCVLVAVPAAAQAPARQPVAEIQDLTLKAMEQYELLEFEQAKKLLDQAEKLCQKYGFTSHPVAARVYLSQGVVLLTAFKDRYAGYRAFLRALTIEPTLTVNATLATKEVTEVFESARKEALAVRKPVPAAATRPAEPEEAPEEEPAEPAIDPRDVRGLLHEAVAEAPMDRPLRLQCMVGADVQASKVFVFYRSPGRDDWTPLPMAHGRGVYQVTIPEAVVRPPWLDYYIEVRDGRGRPQISSGNVVSPHRIAVVKEAPEPKPKEVVKSILAKAAVEESPIEVAQHQRETRQRTPLWARLALGTGVGWVTGRSDALDQPVNAGFASAPLHVAPEVGMSLGGPWAVSVQGRLQVLTLAEKGSSFAGAGLVRGFYTFGQSEKLRPYALIAVGGGYVIHPGPVEDPNDTSRVVKDTFKTGPFLVGPGAGVGYALTPALSLVGEVAALVCAPTNTSVNVDINLGAALTF